MTDWKDKLLYLAWIATLALALPWAAKGMARYLEWVWK